MELLPLNLGLCRQLKAPSDVTGVAVGHVESNNPAAELGIEPAT
jgi:hypothetical protein